MATIISIPTTLTVLAPGTSSLSQLAASMAPGTWAQMAVSSQNSALGVGRITGSMLPFANSMPWNPVSRCIEIMGNDHGWGTVRHVRFQDATGQFSVVTNDANVGDLGHGYDHVSVNPRTGDLYYRQYSGFTGTIRVYRKPFGAASFTAIPSVSTSSEQVAIGTTWWSGSFAGAGAQGALLVFNSGASSGGANDGQILGFDPLAGRWVYNQTGRAPFYGSGSTYHSVFEYSAVKNVAVYGGGNVAGRKLWRLNADGSVTPMPDVPSGKGVGIQQGILVDDPVSGNFLLLSAGELWELNPSGAGTWTRQSGTRTPPSGVAVPRSNGHLVACAISSYGVIAYISQTTSSTGNFYLYKPA